LRRGQDPALASAPSAGADSAAWADLRRLP
jgi:hypothetical protein